MSPGPTSLSVSQATQALTITRAIKTRWHSASRKEDGSYEMAPARSKRRVRRAVIGQAAAPPSSATKSRRLTVSMGAPSQARATALTRVP